MDLKDWAKNEIDIACKKEAPNRENNEWDYGCACYESAYKAFTSLLEDGHSGFSIQMTKAILNRLIDGKPLTLITDDDFFIEANNKILVDPEYLKERGLKSENQCPRMSSLFRTEYIDGKIEYHDVDRCLCINNEDDNVCWHNGFVSKLIDKMYPIEMPYFPPEDKIKVYVEEFLTDEKNGDFDTMGILYIIKDRVKIDVCKYFKSDSLNAGWQEIDEDEYYDRKNNRIDRN